MSHPQSKERWAAKVHEIHGDRIDTSESIYVNSRTPIEVRCTIHNYYFTVKSPRRLNRPKEGSELNLRCPLCIEDAYRISLDEILSRFYQAHGDQLYDWSYVPEDYNGVVKNKVRIICLRCGRVFRQLPRDHASGQGCPHCASNSEGEYLIALILDEFGIPYQREKTFDDLYIDGYLRYDFYLPHIDILIEYHGIAHFQEVPGFRGTLLKRQEIDQIKKDYAEENGIPLITFSRQDIQYLRKKLDMTITYYEDDV